MTKLMLIVVVLAVLYESQGSHLHPRHMVDVEEGLENKEYLERNVDEIPIVVMRAIKPSRFVPVNSEPCEDGFERDVLGICREVWD